MSKYNIAIATLVGVIAGCGAEKANEDPVTQARRQALNQNQSLWNSNNLIDYQIKLIDDYACRSIADSEITVIVRDGSVAEAYYTQSLKPLSGAVEADFYNVDTLFEYIGETVAQEPYVFDVEYNPEYGYPTQIQYDGKFSIADDEFCIVILALQF